jgi:DnaJ-class molecular chaperone
MSDSLYDILGVSRRASEDEIRQAFRKLAKEHHPDLNAGNAAATERFKKISAANEILSDPDRRRQYDAGEIDAKGDPRGPQYRPRPGAQQRGRGNNAGSFDDFGFTDIFSEVFGGRSGTAGPGMGGFARGARGGRGFTPRGQDLRYTLEVDLVEAVLGAKKRVTLPEGGKLDLTVPEGVVEGQILRLKGRGAPGPAGGEAGDALVEIKIKPHRQFKRQGDDILVEVPITIDEAVLGGKIEVPTITGRVQLTIPKGTSSGRTFRLKGKGVKGKAGVGDELVTLRIVLPDTIDDNLSYFFETWRQTKAYDPGRK